MALRMDITIAPDGTVTGHVIPPPPPPAKLLPKAHKATASTKGRRYPPKRARNVLRACSHGHGCGDSFTTPKQNAVPGPGEQTRCKQCQIINARMLTTERQRRYRARLKQQGR